MSEALPLYASFTTVSIEQLGMSKFYWRAVPEMATGAASFTSAAEYASREEAMGAWNEFAERNGIQAFTVKGVPVEGHVICVECGRNLGQSLHGDIEAQCPRGCD